MELKLADLSVENSKYLRKDVVGGVITDKEEIENYKQQQYVDVIDNLMLGNYNEMGEYVIEEEIKAELLACPKVIDDNYENILFVKSVDKANVFSNLNFAVKVLDNAQKGYKTVLLELLEPIYKAKGLVENTQATLISKLVLLDNDLLREEIYKRFNILINQTTVGAKTKDETDEQFKAIIDRKIKLLYIKKKLEMEKEFEIPYKKAITELKKTEAGKKVLEESKKEVEVATKYLNLKETDYKAKSEILIKNIQIKEKKDEFKEIKKLFHEVNKVIAITVKKVVKEVQQTIQTVDKPVEVRRSTLTTSVQDLLK